MKTIRLIAASLIALAALTAGTAQAASAQAFGMRSVNWGNVTIPGQLCEVKGSIRLHNGHATVNHGSGYGIPIEASTAAITHGYLGHGLPVTALQIWCETQGGTAAGQLAEGIMVFAAPNGQPHLLGTLTPQYNPKSAAHIPYISVDRIDTAGHVTVTELFYRPSNPDCCPSGQAVTVWKWTGHKFIPGRTKITAK